VLSARNAPRVNVNSINFAINAGVVVPRHVNVVAVSAFPALIDIVPDFRDDSFFVVDDEIVVLDRSRRVVDVVPAGPRTHFSQNFSRSSVGGGAAASLNLSVTEIREVQQVLIDRGFLTGEVDGVFNDRTRQALISFQRREGIQASGSIDSRTVSSLGLSNRIGQQSNQSTTVGQGQSGTQQNTTGQGSGQANAPAPQNQSTTGQAGGQGQGGAAQQPSAQQQPTAQQNTQAAPQNQSTVGQSGNQPAANQNTPSGQAGQAGQANSPPPSTSGQGNAPPPAQNPGQNPGR